MTHPPEIPESDDFSRNPELDVFNWLNTHKLTHATVSHPATHTVADSAQIKTDISGAHTKNLFLKDKKSNLVLVSAWAHSQLPLNQLHKVIDLQRLSFTKAEQLWESLRVTPGSVSALALIHDPRQHVRFVVDAALKAYETINFHPLRNDMTTSLSRADFEAFVETTGRKVEYVDFSML